MIKLRFKTGYLAAALTAGLLWSACDQKPQTTDTGSEAQQPETMAEATPKPAQKAAAAKKPAAQEKASSGNKSAGDQLASNQAGAPVERKITVPAGTTIKGELETPLSTKTNNTGDIFRIIVSEPIVLESMEVIPKGTVIHGTIASITPSERGSKKASMSLKFESITLISGLSLPIDAGMGVEGDEFEADASIEGESKKKRNAALIAGGAAAGAVAGKLLGKGKAETVIGAAAGGAAGTAAAIAMKGGEVDLKEGSPLSLKLNNPLSVPVRTASGSNMVGQ
jgi:hypothetical protein